jgi:uncharacterized membrane protein YoaK (UPF0700 family)
VRANAWTADPKHGALPILLVGLTAVTGVVDAVSILSLGRVFVANMTGNVVFVGFALAGAPGFSLVASLFALAGFLLGAGACGAVIARRPMHRASLLRDVVLVEFVLVVVAFVICATAHSRLDSAQRDVLALLAAVAMGGQNAAVRKLAVPDLTTTVLTMTLTGIAADLRAGNRAVVMRRVIAVLTMLAGAVGGAALVLHVSSSAALLLAVALLALVGGGAVAVARSPVWT